MLQAEVMYTGIGTHFVHSDNVKDMLQAFYSYPWTDKKSAWIQVEEIIARFASKDHLCNFFS